MKGYLYILRCSDNSYYTGSTNDIELRMMQHHAGEACNYTMERLPVELIYLESYDRIDDAFNREKQIQKWSRAKKEALIYGRIEELKQLARNHTAYPNRK
jgi:putative endonuclease